MLSGFLPHWGRNRASAGEGQLYSWELHYHLQGISPFIVGMVASCRVLPTASLAPGCQSEGVCEQKGSGDAASTIPTLSSTRALKHLSAGQEMGLNFVLAAPFPQFPGKEVKCLLFAFFLNVRCHIHLRKHEQGTVLRALVERW